jgi:hypothetical protein
MTDHPMTDNPTTESPMVDDPMTGNPSTDETRVTSSSESSLSDHVVSAEEEAAKLRFKEAFRDSNRLEWDGTCKFAMLFVCLTDVL